MLYLEIEGKSCQSISDIYWRKYKHLLHFEDRRSSRFLLRLLFIFCSEDKYLLTYCECFWRKIGSTWASSHLHPPHFCKRIYFLFFWAISQLCKHHHTLWLSPCRGTSWGHPRYWATTCGGGRTGRPWRSSRGAPTGSRCCIRLSCFRHFALLLKQTG